jgi:hypothetical protein
MEDFIKKTDLPTNAQVEDAIVKAFETITGGKANGDIGKTVTKYSDQIQNTINYLLSNRGAITKKQLDELDEQVRQAKKATLESESKNTAVKTGLYLAIGLVLFGTLWIITKEKKS